MESPPFPEFQSTCSRTPPGESNPPRFVAGKTLTGITFQAQLFDLENTAPFSEVSAVGEGGSAPPRIIKIFCDNLSAVGNTVAVKQAID